MLPLCDTGNNLLSSIDQQLIDWVDWFLCWGFGEWIHRLKGRAARLRRGGTSCRRCGICMLLRKLTEVLTLRLVGWQKVLDFTCMVADFLNVHIADDHVNLIGAANIKIVIKIRSLVQPYSNVHLHLLSENFIWNFNFSLLKLSSKRVTCWTWRASSHNKPSLIPSGPVGNLKPRYTKQ